MIITGMAHFESVCKKKLVNWYNKNGFADTPVMPPIDLSNVSPFKARGYVSYFYVFFCQT